MVDMNYVSRDALWLVGADFYAVPRLVRMSNSRVMGVSLTLEKEAGCEDVCGEC